jgi:hypothetical protein
MEKMSITRALAEIKRLDDRIEKAIASEFVNVAVGRNENKRSTNRSETLQDTQSKIQSNRDTLTSMFDKRAKIKAAVVQSNAVTKITLGKEELSVAEAIEKKKSIDLKRRLSVTLKQQLNRANELVKNLNEKLDQTIETNLATIYGNDKGKADASMYNAIAEPQKNQKEASLIDPIKIQKWIEELDEEISITDTELDFILSESNAKTEIEI